MRPAAQNFVRVARRFLTFAILTGLWSAVALPAAAQYSIPDCAVARVNDITNTVGGEGWLAGRDQYYQQMSAEWNAETAGLTPAQLSAYAQVYCQTLVISDGGIEQTAGGEVWNLTWSYQPVSAWLAQGGTGTGGTGANTGNASAGDSGASGAIAVNASGAGAVAGGGFVGSAGGATGSGTGNPGVGSGVSVQTGNPTPVKGGETNLGGPTPVPATPPIQPPVAPPTPVDTGTVPLTPPTGAAIFETGFEQMPADLSLLDNLEVPQTAEIITSGGDAALRIKAENYHILYLTSAESLTDYAVEVDARVHAGDIILSARGGRGFCSGYDFGVVPDTRYVYIQLSDQACETELLAEADGLDIAPGEWMTVRFEVQGDFLNASINGVDVLSTRNTAYAAGHPVLYVFGDPDAGDAALVDVSSFRVTESTLVVPPPAPQQLLHYTGAHQNVIAELQAGGLIPSGRTPTLVVQEPLFASEGSGMIYEALAEDAPHADVVIAAALEARFNAPPSDYEACTLLVRVVDDGDAAIEELNAGFGNDGYVVLYDVNPENPDRFAGYRYAPLGGSPDAPHHVLLLAVGDRATLYVNGQLVFERAQVEARAGHHGIGLISASSNSRCEAKNLWAYSLD